MKPNFGEPSPKMIELLSKGKIAVENNDKNIVRQILKLLPNEVVDGMSGDTMYYYESPVRPMEIGNYNHVRKDLPIYKATDFIIPERFCIHITDENREEVKRIAYACGMDGWKWNDNHGPSFSNNAEPYYHYCSKRGSWDCEPTQITDYPLLTFDHFKLLFDGGEEEKEIEGYELQVGPIRNWEKGDKFYPWHMLPGTFYVDKKDGVISKEVIELSPKLFKPIYKSKEVIIPVGSCKIPVHVIPGKRIWVERNGREDQIESEMLRSMVAKTKWNVFEFSPTSFTVSLGNETTQNVTLEEIQKILKTYSNE